MFNSKKAAPKDLVGRQALLWMHPTALVQFMTSSRWVVTEGHLPEDVQFHHVFWDPQRSVWGLVCLSKDFRLLKVGEKMPELTPLSFRWYNPDKDGIIE